MGLKSFSLVPSLEVLADPRRRTHACRQIALEGDGVALATAAPRSSPDSAPGTILRLADGTERLVAGGAPHIAEAILELPLIAGHWVRPGHVVEVLGPDPIDQRDTAPKSFLVLRCGKQIPLQIPLADAVAALEEAEVAHA